MTLEQISYLSQSIAAIAVVASLVFVGIQIRQSEKTQRAAMHTSRLGQIRETAFHIASPGITEGYSKALDADPETTPTEWMQFLFTTMAIEITRDEQYRQFREGLIGEERWSQTKATIVNSMTAPGFRALYQINRAVYSDEYQALLDGLMKKIVPLSSSGRFEAWKSLAAAERARIGGAAQP
ncbi:MAG: hypothetical protein ABL871_14050 [Terricaulis sp.]